MDLIRVGLIGCGAIGSSLARALDQRYAHRARLVALNDRTPAHARALQQSLRARPAIVPLARLIQRSDLVVEAASGAIAGRVARAALAAGRQVLIMSTGGLLKDAASWPRRVARSRGGRLYLPSGGLAGLDGVKALAIGRLRRVELTTSKPPASLAAAPYVQKHRLSLTKLRKPRVIFSGSPQAAVAGFPQNTNVSATLLLSCLLVSPSARRIPVRVRVIADPRLKTNVHEIAVEGDCGRVAVRVESRPSATNPKTSEIAIRSALASLHQLLGGMHVGT